MRILTGLAALLLAVQAPAHETREAGRRLADAAVELSRAIDVYRRRLDARQRDLFDRSQEQWMKHRDAACEFEAGGDPVAHAECLTHHTRERLEAVRRLADCRPGDPCPARLKPAG